MSRFVGGTIGVETLPAGAFPAASRRTLVWILVTMDGVTIAVYTRDREGGAATAVMFGNRTVGPAMVKRSKKHMGFNDLP